MNAEGDVTCLCGDQASVWWPQEMIVRWTAYHYDHAQEPAWCWWARYIVNPIEDALAWVGSKLRRRRR